MNTPKNSGRVAAADAEREEFSVRLLQALKERGYSNSATSLCREFNARSPGRSLSVHAARKWMVGEAIPTQEKLRVLATWLNKSIEWLRYGTAPGRVPGRSNDSDNGRDQLKAADYRLIADINRLDTTHRALVQDIVRAFVRRVCK